MTHQLRHSGIVAVCGVVLAVTFPTWHLHGLAWVALVPLVLYTIEAGPWASARLFFTCGLAFHLMLLQWLISNIYWAGGWAVIGYVLLCILLALFWAALGAGWSYLRSALPSPVAPLILPLLWVVMELAQARLFTGFGWSALGYAQASNLWLAQWASIGGVSLVSAIVVFVNTLLALAFAHPEFQKRMSYLAGAIVTVFIAHVAGGALMAEPDYDSNPMRAGIFQANFSLEMKWDFEYWREMRESAISKSAELQTEGEIDLFVWPEALVMEDAEAPHVVASLQQFARDTQAALFAGAARTDASTKNNRNSSIMVGPDGSVLGYYDKVHLAPFGEYVPFQRFLPFMEKIIPAVGNMEPGNEVKVFPVDNIQIGPLICFEVLFGHMAEELRKRGADALVVITNLGWFGRSNAIPQEFEIARMRAIETRLPLIHAANTGISGVFDPWGRFSVVTGEFVVGSLRRLDPATYTPQQTIMERMGGNLRIPAPGTRLIPYGPLVFPWVALFVTIGLFIWTYVPKREPTEPGSAVEKPAVKKPRSRKPAAQAPVQTELPIEGAASAKPRRKRKPKSGQP